MRVTINHNVSKCKFYLFIFYFLILNYIYLIYFLSFFKYSCLHFPPSTPPTPPIPTSHSVIYRFNAVANKIPVTYFTYKEKNISKIYMEL